MQYIEEKSFSNVEDFLNEIVPWGSNQNLSGYAFRGHSQESYELIPMALRVESRAKLWSAASTAAPPTSEEDLIFHQVHAEYMILREFYRLADQRGLAVPLSPRVREDLVCDVSTMMQFNLEAGDLWIPHDLHEAAALAQHYGMPTRLLDWTYDIFVAMYFAFRGAIGKAGNLCIWAIDKDHLRFHQPTEFIDGVDFIAPHYAGNPHLNAQKGLFTHVPCPFPHYLNFSSDESRKSILDMKVDRRPLNEVLRERIIRPKSGVFKKFMVPCSEAKKGTQILNKLGYDASRIFPGYGGVATELLSRTSYLF